jgi:hypothetical protein
MRRRSARAAGLAGTDLALGAPVSRRAGGRGRVRFKTKAIAEHLRGDPRPFAWADDDLHRHAPPGPVFDLGLEHLLICPRRLTGLTA